MTEPAIGDPAVANPHRRAEERSIALHCAVGRVLLADPRVIDRARSRVGEWLVNGSVAKTYAARWAELLELPTEDLVARLCERSEEMSALRQVSPFAGALSPRERWEILDRSRGAET